MNQYGQWESLRKLGEGGQSDVFVVRTPMRAAERSTCLSSLRANLDRNELDKLATNLWTYSRPEDDSELGALKVFKVRQAVGETPSSVKANSQEAKRFENEVMVLAQCRPGLPRLLGHDSKEFWIVTEFFRRGSLDKEPLMFQGNSLGALRAFRSLVSTVASLHRDKIVHRDIKPANIFARTEGELVLGDLGIVFLPSSTNRLTTGTERVGPWEYMPPWADMETRLESVEPNFDVYMLGKLLWCMIAGRLRLPRENQREPEFDLALQFPDRRQDMLVVNSILDQCVVPRPNQCLDSAGELLELVDESISNLSLNRLASIDGQFDLPCNFCRRGSYRRLPGLLKVACNDELDRRRAPVSLQLYICRVCANYQFFAPGFPEEAEKRNWKPNV